MTSGHPSPSLSIALCTYNGAGYLHDQLQSFVAQTTLPDELVVCDDGSTDGTKDVLEGFAEEAPFPVVVYHNEERKGALRNFEQALSFCKCDVIALSDQDDRWLPGKIEALRSSFEDRSASAVFSDGYLMDADGRQMETRLWEAVDLPSRSLKRWEETLIRRLPNANLVTGAALALRRGLVQDVVPFPEGWVHDAWIALVAACCGELRPLPEPLILYRLHPKQQIGLRLPPSFSERIELRRQHLDVWRRARTDWSDPLVERAAQLEDALDRILVLAKKKTVDARFTDELTRRVDHYRVRARLRGSSGSVRWVLRELFLGRYRRYSNGVSSAVKDLMNLV